MKKKILLIALAILLVIFLMVAYTFLPSPIDLSKYDSAADFALIEKTKVDFSRLPAVTLSIIKTGRNLGPEAFIYRGGSWRHQHESAFIGVLVRHPNGTILFDTGLGTKVDEQVVGNSYIDK